MTKPKTIAQWGDKLLPLTPALYETYRPLPGFGGDYFVDQQGHVLTTAGKTPPGYARRLKISKSRPQRPYNRLTLFLDGKQIHYSLSRLILEAWTGPPPSEHHCARHLDGKTDHDELSNLEWALPVQIKLGAIIADRVAAGERSHNARFTNDRVAAIRRLATEFHAPGNLIAAATGEHQPRISELIRGENFRTKQTAIERSGSRAKYKQ